MTTIHSLVRPTGITTWAIALSGALAIACSSDSSESNESDATDTMSDMMASSTGDTPPASGTTPDEPDEPGTGSGDLDDGGSSGEPDLADPYGCVETDPQIAPLEGPGWDPATESLMGETQESYVVHTTQILVKPDKLGDFMALGDAIGAQLMQTPGLVAVGFYTEPNCGFFRTTGIWESEEAMYAFVTSGAHAEAMAATRDVSFTGKVTHFEVDAAELPVTWPNLIERIDAVDESGVYR